MSKPSSESEPGDCASKLKVLADPTRLEVLRALMGSPQRVGTLQELVGVEQSLLSHHLRVLRDAGLVRSTREGKGYLYHLAPGVVLDDPSSLELGCCRLEFPGQA
jgi:DNA-binding transcriptional ArsR family regulator